MARIRSVHPGQWSDEDFVECSFAARLLAIALRNEADDQGVFEWKPKAIKMRCMPADSVDIDGLLKELAAHNIVKQFTEDGRQYGAIRNFRVYQKPKKPNSVYPLPTELRNYVAINGHKVGTLHHPDDDGSEPDEEIPEACSVPVPHRYRNGSELTNQMEDGGGSKEDGGSKKNVRTVTLPREGDDIFRFCEALGVTWRDTPSRRHWPALLFQAKERGLNFEKDIVPAALEAKARGKPSIEYALKVAESMREKRGQKFEPEPPNSPPKTTDDRDWDARLRVFSGDAQYSTKGDWSESWGPKPGEPGCLCPKHLLEEPRQ